MDSKEIKRGLFENFLAGEVAWVEALGREKYDRVIASIRSDLNGVESREVARVGYVDGYKFVVCDESYVHPCFRLKRVHDFEIVIRNADNRIIEVVFNETNIQFHIGERPPLLILETIIQFMSDKNSKDQSKTNAEACDFAWKLLND